MSARGSKFSPRASGGPCGDLVQQARVMGVRGAVVGVEPHVGAVFGQSAAVRAPPQSCKVRGPRLHELNPVRSVPLARPWLRAATWRLRMRARCWRAHASSRGVGFSHSTHRQPFLCTSARVTLDTRTGIAADDVGTFEAPVDSSCVPYASCSCDLVDGRHITAYCRRPGAPTRTFWSPHRAARGGLPSCATGAAAGRCGPRRRSSAG